MNEHMQIAQTIKDQLMMGGRSVVWSWGAHGYMALPDTLNYQGGLQFRVQGRLYTGKVQVWLAYNDTYSVVLENLAEPFENVYCDMLLDLIDGLVETP